MATQLFVNNFRATLKTAVAIGSTSATLSPTGIGASLPALANGDYVILTLAPSDGKEASQGQIKVTGVSGDVITFDAAASAWSVGSLAQVRIPAEWLNSISVLPDQLAKRGAGFDLNKRRAVYAGVTQSTFSGGLTNIRTTYGKCEVDAVPLRARVCVRSRLSDFNLSHWDFAVAMTEVFTDNSDAEKFSPIVGGTEYNSAPPAGYQYGWIVGNMANGGVTGTLHEITSDATKLTVACGPWIDLPYVPRADGKKGGIVLFRAVHNNAGSNFSVKSANVTAGGTGADYKSRKFWTRASANNVNGITTFTNVPSAATDDTGVADVYLEFEFATPVRSVWADGDSITANFEYTGWAMQAIWAASTTEKPVIPFLNALSGSAMSTFVDMLLNYSTVTGSVPTDLIIPCFSPNGVQTSDQTVLDAQATLTTVLNWAKVNGVRVFFWDGCPNNSYTSVQQVRLNAMRTWAKGQVAAGNAYKFIEMARAVSATYGTTTGDKFTTGLNGDNTHPNQTGANRMSPLANSGLMMN